MGCISIRWRGIAIRSAGIAIRSAGIAIRWLRIAIRWRGIRSGGGENWSFFVRFWLCGGVSA